MAQVIKDEGDGEQGDPQEKEGSKERRCPGEKTKRRAGIAHIGQVEKAGNDGDRIVKRQVAMDPELR